MFKLQNITKKYNDKIVLNNLNYELSSDKEALFGINGAGKTTILNIVAEIDTNFSGQLTLKNCSNAICFDQNELFEYLSFNEILNFITYEEHLLQQLIKLFKVKTYLHVPLHQLSFGTQRKMNLMFALIAPVEYIFLDEPTNGLDYISQYNLSKFIKKDSRKYFIISHDLNFLKQTCSKLSILSLGSIQKQINISTISFEEMVEQINGVIN